MKARIETSKDFDPFKTKVFNINTNEEFTLITSLKLKQGPGFKKGTIEGFIPQSPGSKTPLLLGNEVMRYAFNFEIGEIKIIS